MHELKQECIDITSIWRQHRCPQSGEINDKRVKMKLRYKYAIKEAITSADKDFNENLADHVCKTDFQRNHDIKDFVLETRNLHVDLTTSLVIGTFLMNSAATSVELESVTPRELMTDARL